MILGKVNFMVMTMENPKSYRDILAKDLKDLRSQEDGRVDADEFLRIAKKTQSYQEAKTEHLTEQVDVVESEQPHEEHGSQIEGMHERLANELFQLIENNPGFTYGVMANGNLRASESRGPRIGFETYIYDKEAHKLIYHNTTTNGGILGNELADRFTPYRESFRTYYRRDGSFIYEGQINYSPSKGNAFTSETRSGLYFAYALIRELEMTRESTDSEELDKFLAEPGSPEGREFWNTFFDKANERYAPEYWAFIKEEKAKWEAQQGV
ncbi:hypothetical protein BH11PAT2_BH11PAT2_01800 [soil metagenome]